MPMPIVPHSSYYDKNYRQTAALIRARQPYLIKNIIGGITLTAFVIGVYAWTIHAVSQDDFSDVPVPNGPSQPPHTPNVGVGKAVDSKTLKNA